MRSFPTPEVENLKIKGDFEIDTAFVIFKYIYTLYVYTHVDMANTFFITNT